MSAWLYTLYTPCPLQYRNTLLIQMYPQSVHVSMVIHLVHTLSTTIYKHFINTDVSTVSTCQHGYTPCTHPVHYSTETLYSYRCLHSRYMSAWLYTLYTPCPLQYRNTLLIQMSPQSVHVSMVIHLVYTLSTTIYKHFIHTDVSTVGTCQHGYTPCIHPVHYNI